jgi:cbb3-type cytochrome oxidase subunit 3
MWTLLLIVFLYAGWYFATGTQKTQWVRLIDIFVYGPYLIYLSTNDSYTFSEYEKLFLVFFGATTIAYNARNYLKK